MIKIESSSIAFYCPQIYPCSTGGLEIFTYYLIKEIKETNKVVLFTDCKSFNETNILKKHIFNRLFLFRRFYLGELSGLLYLLFQLIRCNISINVFHVPHTNSSRFIGLVFPLIKFFFRINYVVVLHGGNINSFKKGILQNQLMRHAKQIIAVSEAIAKEYRKLIDQNIMVIPSLIPFFISDKKKDALKEKYQLPSNSKVLLSVGSIKPIKSPETIINAFLNLKTEYIEANNLYLLIAGVGEQTDVLKYIASKSIINKRIIFLGIIKNEFVHELYALADIYIIASLFESLSKSLLEAMFNGLPIIASNVPVINKTITNNKNGLLFEVKNYQDLSLKIKCLTDYPSYANKLGKEAKKLYNEKFNYQKVIDAYLNVYNS